MTSYQTLPQHSDCLQAECSRLQWTEALEIEASYLVAPGDVHEAYRFVLGPKQRRCDAVVTHTKTYFDTSTLELMRRSTSVALTARPDGRQALICKLAGTSRIAAAAREKVERALMLRHADDLAPALQELSRSLGLLAPLEPVLSLNATRHYRVIRWDAPKFQLSLDAIVG